MATCELCGEVVDSTTTVRVAGSNMQACNKCKKLGKEVEEKKQNNLSYSFRKRKKEGEVELNVIENYSSIINSALAKKGLNIHQLARMLNIKESTLNKYFTGKIKPDVQTAQRLEKFFEISLLEEKEAVNIEELMSNDEDSSSLSLGDMIKKQMEEKK